MNDEPLLAHFVHYTCTPVFLVTASGILLREPMDAADHELMRHFQPEHKYPPGSTPA